VSCDDSGPAHSNPDPCDPTLGDPAPGAPRGTGRYSQSFADRGERYERQGLLGEGRMGKVYAARDHRLRRPVALKVAVRPELASRLATEAWITAQLERPGIVAVYDAGETDGQAWSTMRLIRGRTLHDCLRGCTATAERLAYLPHLLAACQAVAYAHAMGIVHRDLKPANIMVGEFGETQVADWGLARPLDEARQDWTRIVSDASLSTCAGTPRYMSPEQARGEQATRASDVSCLGAALYELLSGQAPPEEAGRPPDLGSLPADVPPDLVAVARRALALDPAERYPSAAELSADLERWLAGRRVLAHAYPPAELLLRVLRAWRAPLTGAGLALVALTVVGVLAARRTAAERALAQANYAEALAQQALAALLADRLPEARIMAAHVLALGPSPVARGIIAATDLPAAERLHSTPLPAGCVDAAVVSPDAKRLACFGGAAVQVYALPGLKPLWSQPVRAIDTPAWVGEHLAVTSEAGLAWLSEAGTEPVSSLRLSVLPAATGVFAHQGQDIRWLQAGQPARAFETCAAPRVVLATAGDTLVVGCSDGVLRRYTSAGEVASAADLGTRPSWSALAVRGQALLVGRLDGGVQTVNLATGQASEPHPGFVGSVRSLLPVPDTTLVLVQGERSGVRV